jgi:hypothetical protein
MANMDDRTTAMTLAMLRNAHLFGRNLGAVSITSTIAAMNVLAGSIERDKAGPGHVLFRQVQRLVAASVQDKAAARCFVFPDPTGVYLNPEFVAQARVDYTGDGIVDPDVDAFVVALDAAAQSVEMTACEAKDVVTVVFMADIRTGNRDLNCATINPFKFASNEEGKQMFLAGGMETDDQTALTPVCTQAKGSECLTKDEWAGVNKALGNWVPNQVPMRDDGQGGDAVSGDGVWTAVFDLPYIAVGTGAEGKRGVRVGYKYTYGFPGQGWGKSEEWPGNHRVLELADLNGDGLVVRYDYFGDETSNKNVANINQGLCGSNKNPWPEQASPGCFSDVHENRVDTDADCKPDTFPSPGAVVPNCVESNVPPVFKVESAWGVSANAPTLSTLTPTAGRNGGGFLVEAYGNNLRNAGLGIEVNSASDMSISGNAVPGFMAVDPGRLLFLAPPFVAAKANVALLYTGGAAKLPLDYTVARTAPCSLVYPASMPDNAAGVGSGKVDQESVPVLARLAVEDPAFAPELSVEVGLSPPCCGAGDACSQGFPPCGAHPDPQYEAGWTFVPADLDAACAVPGGSGLAACEAGVSQFGAAVVPAASGARYRYAVRYSFDYGLSYDYCDLAADGAAWGNDDGFQLKNAGQMWSE